MAVHGPLLGPARPSWPGAPASAARARSARYAPGIGLQTLHGVGQHDERARAVPGRHAEGDQRVHHGRAQRSGGWQQSQHGTEQTATARIAESYQWRGRGVDAGVVEVGRDPDRAGARPGLPGRAQDRPADPDAAPVRWVQQEPGAVVDPDLHAETGRLRHRGRSRDQREPGEIEPAADLDVDTLDALYGHRGPGPADPYAHAQVGRSGGFVPTAAEGICEGVTERGRRDPH